MSMYKSQTPSVNSNPLMIKETKGSASKVGEINQDKQDSNHDQNELKLFVVIKYPQI